MLQWMPSCSNTLAAWMPSHVEAILIKTRLLLTPAASYNAIKWRPLVMVACVSNESCASVSVETRPGINAKICKPKAINKWSIMSLVEALGCCAIVCFNSGKYSGFWTAFKISEGLVVASCGAKIFID